MSSFEKEPHMNTDRSNDLGRLAARWLRTRKLWVAAHSAYEAIIDDDNPIARRREDEYHRVGAKPLAIENQLYGMAADMGAVTPHYVQAGHFIIAIAPSGGLMDGDEQLAVIDLRRRIEPAMA